MKSNSRSRALATRRYGKNRNAIVRAVTRIYLAFDISTLRSMHFRPISLTTIGFSRNLHDESNIRLFGVSSAVSNFNFSLSLVFPPFSRWPNNACSIYRLIEINERHRRPMHVRLSAYVGSSFDKLKMHATITGLTLINLFPPQKNVRVVENSVPTSRRFSSPRCWKRERGKGLSL